MGTLAPSLLGENGVYVCLCVIHVCVYNFKTVNEYKCVIVTLMEGWEETVKKRKGKKA